MEKMAMYSEFYTHLCDLDQCDLHLHHAAEAGDCQALGQLCEESDFDPDIQDHEGNTALIVATVCDHKDAVRVLLQAGSDLNKENKKGNTALLEAVRKGNQQLADILLSAGANGNGFNKSQCISALMEACRQGNLQMTKLLLTTNMSQSDINATNNSMRLTALHLACANGHIQCMKALLDHGSNIDVPDRYGHTVLYYSTFNLQILKMLLAAGADETVRTKKGDTLLHSVTKRDQLASLEYLLAHTNLNIDAVNNRDDTPLIEAARLGNYEIIESLINHGCNLDLGTETTALKEAAYFGDARLTRRLLLAGANPDISSTFCAETALYWAVTCDHIEIVRELVHANCRTDNIKGPMGACVAALRQCHWDILLFLLETGSDETQLLQVDNASYFHRCSTKDKFLNLITMPVSLKAQCRKRLRHCLGHGSCAKIRELPLPHVLKQYVDLADYVEILGHESNKDACNLTATEALS